MIIISRLNTLNKIWEHNLIIINIPESLKICNKTDDFLNYTAIVTSENFKKKIEQECEIPNCDIKEYHSLDFLDSFDVTNTTEPSIIEHYFNVNTKAVSALWRKKLQFRFIYLYFLIFF